MDGDDRRKTPERVPEPMTEDRLVEIESKIATEREELEPNPMSGMQYMATCAQHTPELLREVRRCWAQIEALRHCGFVESTQAEETQDV